ncbi:hypothetical protein NPIL_47011 [Nephila pilipes]|uniref:Uncharacterized protein n=1 Tax=Nephila pilipes TaxID=299642 RepID=A0A8X6UAA9_NEPPI|nr:hypothetical protein NPIL_47011 [Nephila pilipes]
MPNQPREIFKTPCRIVQSLIHLRRQHFPDQNIRSHTQVEFICFKLRKITSKKTHQQDNGRCCLLYRPSGSCTEEFGIVSFSARHRFCKRSVRTSRSEWLRYAQPKPVVADIPQARIIIYFLVDRGEEHRFFSYYFT